MSRMNNKNCGCKGIRTCLLCETLSETANTSSSKNVQAQAIYKYCPHCDLCWPDDENIDVELGLPFYLGKLRLILDFLTEEEEAAAVSAIDGIQWMPSQSGRRKQDFGPKVNFKKKKVKVSTFTGFPKFTENILQKFKNVPELSDFQAVELCHLEYTPERGSSIDSHVDDFWLWGERLVTVNLGSSTVLTLVPFSDDACECREQTLKKFPGFPASSSQNKNACNHFQNIHLSQNASKSLFVSSNLTSINKKPAVNDIVDAKLNEDIRNLQLFNACNESKVVTHIPTQAVNHSGENKFQSLIEETPLKFKSCNVVCELPSKTDSLSKCFDLPLNEDGKRIRSSYHTRDNSTELHLNTQTSSNGIRCDVDSGKVNDICTVFRRERFQPEVALRIVLPPRSLLILAGCARYNWCHEIKRHDVISRRLAMTFRELTPQFLEGGKESHLGKELLSIASNLRDFN